jgi:hypothetical protein
MSRIPVPERGQPLDLSYIYTIAQAINELSEKGSALTQSNNFYHKSSNGGQSSYSSKLYGAQVYSSYLEIASDTAVNAGNEKSLTITFPPEVTFANTPVITATPVALNDNEANKAVSVILSNTGPSGYTITAKFATSGKVSVGVNVIAMGLPSQ